MDGNIEKYGEIDSNPAFCIKAGIYEKSLESTENIILENGNSSGVAGMLQGLVLLQYKATFAKGNKGEESASQKFHRVVKEKYGLANRAVDRRIQLWNKVEKNQTQVTVSVVNAIRLDIMDRAIAVDRTMVDKITEQIGNHKTLTDLFREAGILAKEDASGTIARGVGTGKVTDLGSLIHDLRELVLQIKDRINVQQLADRMQQLCTWLEMIPAEEAEIEKPIALGKADSDLQT